MVTPDGLHDAIAAMVRDEMRRAMPSLLLGTLQGVSGGKAQVVIDGDVAATPCAAYCAAAAGDRVLVARQGTQAWMIGGQR